MNELIFIGPANGNNYIVMLGNIGYPKYRYSVAMNTETKDLSTHIHMSFERLCECVCVWVCLGAASVRLICQFVRLDNCPAINKISSNLRENS